MLTEDQKRAYDAMLSGKNIFLTGEAGTGKSFLLNKFIEDLEGEKNILITAPTGIAAIEIGGATLHRTFQIPISDLEKIKNGPKKAGDAIEAADILIIDEISMCRLDVFEYVLKAVQLVNRKRDFKNRMQVILVGDFLQLPPILSSDERNMYNSLHGHTEVFPFMSEMWGDFNFETVHLKKIVRQEGDEELIHNLNLARKGDTSCIEYFNQFYRPELEADENAIFICPTNKDATAINKRKIDAIDSDPITYKAEIKGEVKNSDKATDDEITLKVGARVMTLVNASDGTYYNGSMGTCVDLRKASVIVKLDSGRTVVVSKHEWEVRKYEVTTKTDTKGKTTKELKLKKIGSFKQIPIKIAFAITTHKSQGQTFQKVVINPYAWDSGQLYVALSRVTSSEGLQLSRPIYNKYLLANDDVIKFYEGNKKARANVQMGFLMADQDMLDELMADEGNDIISEEESLENEDSDFPLKLKAMYFPEAFEDVLKAVNKSLLEGDREAFLAIAEKIWDD